MGLGFFWKPVGPTSSYFLGQVKKELGLAGASREGIGHAGTLDPFAEGWLLVGWGEGTKLLAGLKNLTKTYVAETLLGYSSDTLDNTSELRPWNFDPKPQAEKLKKFLQMQVGSFGQMPPQFSAKKVGGQAAYDLARMGKVVDLKPQTVEILSIDHLYLEAGDRPCTYRWGVRVKVSSGTYIRAFARDWASELFGAPACLAQLQRIGVGVFEETRNKEPRIFKAFGDLAPFFQFHSEAAPPANRQASTLLQEQGELKAVWLTDSQRWRYFNASPLV